MEPKCGSPDTVPDETEQVSTENKWYSRKGKDPEDKVSLVIYGLATGIFFCRRKKWSAHYGTYSGFLFPLLELMH